MDVVCSIPVDAIPLSVDCYCRSPAIPTARISQRQRVVDHKKLLVHVDDLGIQWCYS